MIPNTVQGMAASTLYTPLLLMEPIVRLAVRLPEEVFGNQRYASLTPLVLGFPLKIITFNSVLKNRLPGLINKILSVPM